MTPLVLTDQEVADVFRISVRTLRRCLREGPVNGGYDLRTLNPTVVGYGGSRRWDVGKVADLANIDKDEMMKRLGY